MGSAVLFEDGKQFILAVEATHRVVPGVVRILELTRLHHVDRDSVLAGKGKSFFQVGSRQAGRVGNHCQHFVAEDLVRGPGQESRIHSARVGDEQAAADF